MLRAKSFARVEGVEGEVGAAGRMYAGRRVGRGGRLLVGGGGGGGG